MATSDKKATTARERVDARRRSKARQPAGQGSPASVRRASPAAASTRLGATRRTVGGKSVKSSMAERQRSAATRKPRPAAVPGPRQAAVSWVASGRMASMIMLFGSLLGLIYLLTSPSFTVQHVDVAGTNVMKPDEVVNLADAQGLSIWYVDTAAILEKLQSSAYVEQARVSVSLPDTLDIQVTERTPELRWSSGGQQYFVDASGRVLGAAPATSTLSNTLVIDDRSLRVLQPNDYVDSDALALGNALALRLTPETGVQALSFNWSPEQGVFVTAPDNKTIIFGTSERLDEKLVVLDTLLKSGSAFTYLDLRPLTPYYRNGA